LDGEPFKKLTIKLFFMNETRFAIVGYGRIGKLVEQVLNEVGRYQPEIIDPALEGFGWDDNSLTETDTAICFTSPPAGYETTKRVLEKGVDAVVGTTKFYLNNDGSENEEMLQEFDELAKENDCRMFYASNFSVGMNAFWKLLKPMAEMMRGLGYDVAIEERHHKRKVDVAGTAKYFWKLIRIEKH
jgi:4-hydroxy-tetrahydrodipicolinate reductase